jgi:hypothetical protein
VNPCYTLVSVADRELCETTDNVGNKRDSQAPDRIETADLDGSNGERLDQGRVDLCRAGALYWYN